MKLFITLAMIMSFCCFSAAQNEVIGTITKSYNQVFTIVCEKTDKCPLTKDTCSVSKDISGTKNPFGITITSGWLEVADAVFIEKKGDQLSFKVVKEKSEVIINGKKQEHFVKGKRMKIAW